MASLVNFLLSIFISLTPILCDYSEQSVLLAIKRSLGNGGGHDAFVTWHQDPRDFEERHHCFEWSHVSCNSDYLVTDLFLGSSNLYGEIPMEVGELANLNILDLSDNHLEGEIPTFLSTLKSLSILSLNSNNFSGKIPTELGNLKFLEDLSLSDNKIEGAIPKSLSHLKSLLRLQLDNNTLSGPIPRELAALSNLVTLELDSNKLSGSIPRELATLSNLDSFNVSNNNLSGQIPVGGPFATFNMSSFENNRLLELPTAQVQSGRGRKLAISITLVALNLFSVFHLYLC